MMGAPGLEPGTPLIKSFLFSPVLNDLHDALWGEHGGELVGFCGAVSHRAASCGGPGFD